jgi:hypothetical protein
MESRLAQYDAQFQGLTQILANMKAATAVLGPLAPLVSPQIEFFARMHLKVIEHRTVLIETAKEEITSVVIPPSSVCHSECGSYTDSSSYDSSCSSSSDVPAPDCSDCSDSPRQKRSNVHSERAVSPERASLHLQVRISIQRAPLPPSFSKPALPQALAQQCSDAALQACALKRYGAAAKHYMHAVACMHLPSRALLAWMMLHGRPTSNCGGNGVAQSHDTALR